MLLVSLQHPLLAPPDALQATHGQQASGWNASLQPYEQALNSFMLMEDQSIALTTEKSLIEYPMPINQLGNNFNINEVLYEATVTSI